MKSSQRFQFCSRDKGTGNIYKNCIQINKKAERKAAELPPSRSDRWQANYFDKKVCAVRFRSRSAAVNGRAAAGSAAFLLLLSVFIKYISGTFVLYIVNSRRLCYVTRMKQKLYDYSFDVKKQRRRTIVSVILFFLIVFAGVSLVRSFALFTVRSRSVSMQPDIPSDSCTVFTPIVKNLLRGDVVMLKSRRTSSPPSVFATAADAVSRFFTAQQYSLFGSDTPRRRFARRHRLYERLRRLCAACGGQSFSYRIRTLRKVL